MDYSNIIELHSGTDIREINNLISKGWVFINSHTSSDEYGSQCLYIVGRPRGVDSPSK